MARVTVPKIQEFTIHPFGIGNLVVNGVQYTQLYNTNVTNTYISTNGGAFNVIDDTYPGGRFDYYTTSLDALMKGYL